MPSEPRANPAKYSAVTVSIVKMIWWSSSSVTNWMVRQAAELKERIILPSDRSRKQ